jgi:hypothetical protein
MIETTAEGPAMQLGDASEPGETLGRDKTNLYQALYDRQFGNP